MAVATISSTLPVRNRVVHLLAQECDVPEEDILDHMLLLADLGLGRVIGSGELLDFKHNLEHEFGITIPPDRLPPSSDLQHVTVANVVSLITSLEEK